MSKYADDMMNKHEPKEGMFAKEARLAKEAKKKKEALEKAKAKKATPKEERKKQTKMFNKPSEVDETFEQWKKRTGNKK